MTLREPSPLPTPKPPVPPDPLVGFALATAAAGVALYLAGPVVAVQVFLAVLGLFRAFYTRQE